MANLTSLQAPLNQAGTTEAKNYWGNRSGAETLNPPTIAAKANADHNAAASKAGDRREKPSVSYGTFFFFWSVTWMGQEWK